MKKEEMIQALMRTDKNMVNKIQVAIVKDGATEPQYVDVDHCYYHDKRGFVVVPAMPLEVCLE